MDIYIGRVLFDHLDSAQRLLYEELTPPRYHCCFLQQDPDHIADTTVIPLGAWVDGKPAAVGIASLYQHMHAAKVHLLSVADFALGLNLPSLLLNGIEKECGALKCRTMLFTFTQELEEKLHLREALREQHWQKEQLSGIHAFYHCKDFHPAWFEKEDTLPLGWEIFPWRDISEEEQKQLLHREQQSSFPLFVSPFGKNEASIEPLNSLGVRYEGEIAGWMITHRSAPDTIRYSSLYLDREYRTTGIGIQLVKTSVKKQQTSSIPYSTFDISLSQIDSSWLHFVQRRLIPYAQQVSHSYHTWKALGVVT